MYPADVAVVSLSLVNNETYEAQLATILRKRRGPLFLLISAGGGLRYSTLPDSAPPAEQRLLGQAYAEAQALISAGVDHSCDPDEGDTTPGTPLGTLTVLEGVVYSVRLFPLYLATTGRDLREGQYAVIIEPIVGPLTDGVNFALIKSSFHLSNRELDVLIALMTGTKDKLIARSLGVSVGTVRAYLKSVRAKLGVTTRTAIVNLVHEVSGKKTVHGETQAATRFGPTELPL